MADAVAVSWRNLFSIFDPTTLDKTARTHTWFNTHKMCVKHKKGVKKWIAKKGVGQTRNQRVFWRRPARSAATYSLTTTSAVGWLTFTPPLQPLSSVFVFCFFLFFFVFRHTVRRLPLVTLHNPSPSFSSRDAAAIHSITNPITQWKTCVPSSSVRL